MGIKINVVAFWQGEIYDLKVVKYLDESKSLKTASFICLCWLTSRLSNWLILARDISYGCNNMCANPRSNWLNTIAVRALYILPILRRFPWWKPRKTGGWSVSPRKTPKQKPLCIFEFWGRPFKLAKFHWNRWDGMQQDCPVHSWTHS